MTMNNMKPSVSTPLQLFQHGYKLLEQIGEGANGKTYKAINLITGEFVAVKALKFSDNLKNYELFEREAQTLQSIHTPGTPAFYNYIAPGSEFTECWLVQEFVNGRSLFDMLEKGETFDETQMFEILLETAQIVHTLQTRYAPPIIHRDIKPSNILVREKRKDGMKLCLIDFGAVANPQQRGVNSTVAGTVGYMAPEQLIGNCTIQSDYYALGTTALHLLTGINPINFPSNGFTLQFEETLKQKVPDINKETIELLKNLLATNPSDRPKDANELLQKIGNACSAFNKNQDLLGKKIKKYEEIQNFTHHEKFVEALLVLCSITFFMTFLTLLISLIDYDLSAEFLVMISVIIVAVIIIGGFIYFKHIKSFIKDKKAKFESSSKIRNIPRVKFTDTPTKSQKIGVIRAISANYIEYTVQNGRKYYTSFMIANNAHMFKIGDKIPLK